MRTFFPVAFAFIVGCSIASAEAASAQPEAIRFAALTVTDGQGARAVISNAPAPGTDTNVTPCKVQVKFFDAEGSLIGDAETLQLKPGASGSITATGTLALVRAAVSIDESSDASSLCELKARVEIFDLHTGTTFISVSGDPPARTSDCTVTSSISSSRALKRQIAGASVRPVARSANGGLMRQP